MCTAISFKTKDLYFGRTLDIEAAYYEEVVITPRKYKFKFKNGKEIDHHFAIIGMAYVVDDYPLYYDAANEKGLCIAGLNFVDNAKYNTKQKDKNNLAVFELIPWLLSNCKSVSEAETEIKKTNLTNTAFNVDLPAAQLHWLIADKEKTITVEAVEGGIKIYENPVGVLTNNPPFEIQLHQLQNYMKLSPKSPSNEFSGEIKLTPYSRGMGAIGLPGDLSSSSRFVRAAFTKLNSEANCDEISSVGQFFHILGSVQQVRGCCLFDDKYEITSYTSCINADKGIYYYTTYENRRITAVNMQKENVDTVSLIRFPIVRNEDISYQNK